MRDWSSDVCSSDLPATGHKLGMQTPAGGRTAAHEKTRVVINARENVSFSDIVGVLENTLVAEEGLEPPTRGL